MASPAHAAMQRIDSAICSRYICAERKKIAQPDSRGPHMSQTQNETQKDRPWLIRTYAGHSTAKPRTRSTARTSRAGRPAFRWPSTCRRRQAMTATTCWRVARWARSACRSAIWATCATLFDEIPLEQMNTSMTINATAPWLLSLYIAVAEEQGADTSQAARHGAERPDQGIPVARHLYLPAEAVAEDDRGRGRILLQASPSGTR